MFISVVVIFGVLYYSVWILCFEMVVYFLFFWIMSILLVCVFYLIVWCLIGCIDDDLSLFNIN